MLRSICLGVLIALAVAPATELAAAPKQSRAAAPEATLGSIVYAGWEWMMSPGQHAGKSPPGMPQRGDKGFPDWCRKPMSASVDAAVPFFMRDRAYCYRGR